MGAPRERGVTEDADVRAGNVNCEQTPPCGWRLLKLQTPEPIVFKYYGAKYKLRGVYPSPQCDTIIEPFAGSGSYAVHHRNTAKRVILIEKDDRVVALWHRLLGMSAADIRAIPDPVRDSQSTDLLTFFAAGKPPESIIRRLNQETARALEKPAVREILLKNGEVVGGSPEQGILRAANSW